MITIGPKLNRGRIVSAHKMTFGETGEIVEINEFLRADAPPLGYGEKYIGLPVIAGYDEIISLTADTECQFSVRKSNLVDNEVRVELTDYLLSER